MNDTQQDSQRLTPELVCMAISAGMLDRSLDAMTASIRTRREVISKNRAGSMVAGDSFLVENISPKWWEGVEMVYTGRREGIWLVCRFASSDERDCLQRQHPRFNITLEQKFRESHVGLFTRHQLTQHNLGGDL